MDQEQTEATEAESTEAVYDTRTHFERHPNDSPAHLGMIRVRIDGGDSTTKREDRQYFFVKAGYGEKQRIKAARAFFASKMGQDLE
jgi:hypothetical protein